MKLQIFTAENPGKRLKFTELLMHKTLINFVFCGEFLTIFIEAGVKCR
jgi:hypothetical protein